jgi:hypothetical protein
MRATAWPHRFTSYARQGAPQSATRHSEVGGDFLVSDISIRAVANPAPWKHKHSHARSIVAWSGGSHRTMPDSPLRRNSLVRWLHSNNHAMFTSIKLPEIFFAAERPHAADKQVPRPCRQDCQELQLALPTIVPSPPEPQTYNDHSRDSRTQQSPSKAAKRAETRGLAIACTCANSHQRTSIFEPSQISQHSSSVVLTR